MNIELNKKQYKNLIKLVYLGNWLINAIRLSDEQIEKYNRLVQYIYSFAKDVGLEKYIKFDKDFERFFPSAELETDAEVEQYREEYDNEVFWQDLIDRLSWRDFVRKYGEKKIKRMDLKERIEKLSPLEEKYFKEFEKRGIEGLEITK